MTSTTDTDKLRQLEDAVPGLEANIEAAQAAYDAALTVYSAADVAYLTDTGPLSAVEAAQETLDAAELALRRAHAFLTVNGQERARLQDPA